MRHHKRPVAVQLNDRIGGSNPPPATNERHCRHAVAFACLPKRQFPRRRPQDRPQGRLSGPIRLDLRRQTKTQFGREAERLEQATKLAQETLSLEKCGRHGPKLGSNIRNLGRASVAR